MDCPNVNSHIRQSLTPILVAFQMLSSASATPVVVFSACSRPTAYARSSALSHLVLEREVWQQEAEIRKSPIGGTNLHGDDREGYGHQAFDYGLESAVDSLGLPKNNHFQAGRPLTPSRPERMAPANLRFSVYNGV